MFHKTDYLPVFSTVKDQNSVSNKPFSYSFPAAENLSPAIDPERFNFILTWFLPLYFNSSQMFFNSSNKAKNLMSNFVVFPNIV